jgi:hypothetical protein
MDSDTKGLAARSRRDGAITWYGTGSDLGCPTKLVKKKQYLLSVLNFEFHFFRSAVWRWRFSVYFFLVLFHMFRNRSVCFGCFDTGLKLRTKRKKITNLFKVLEKSCDQFCLRYGSGSWQKPSGSATLGHALQLHLIINILCELTDV